LPNLRKKEIGFLANQAKNKIIQALENKNREFLSAIEKEEKKDVTLPGEKPELGYIHPLSQAQHKLADIFLSMGFEVLDGPELETD